MSSLINQILKQSLATFKNADKSMLQSNLEKLKTLVNTITFADVGLKDINAQPSKLIQSPGSYIDIYECDTFIAAIFIIRKGMSIPLHDHPGMFGICKVIHGKVKITAYDPVDCNGDGDSNKQEVNSVIKVKRQSPLILTPNDKCSILHPFVGNFHSIHSIDGDAAIFDILSPPYSEKRDCHYYREVNLSGNHGLSDQSYETYLTEVQHPMDFYCSTLPYTGPKIVPP